jgi:hypothetical protein
VGSKTVVESSKTDNSPWAPAQPAILKGLEASTATYDLNQPMLQRASTQLQGSYDRLAPGAEQGIQGAQSLVNRNISGANLQGNPYLDGMIAKTRNNTLDMVNSGFSQAGQSGLGGRRAQILTRELADAENNLRYQNYGQERAYQQDAIGQSQDLMRGSQSLLENSTMLPYQGVAALNGNVRQASAGYGSTTSNSRKVTNDPIGDITALGGLGLKAFTTFSDDRMKENKQPLGLLAGGVPVTAYNFKGEDQPRVGVLASDVAAVRPDALGPVVGGAQTVNYGALGPEGAQLARTAGPLDFGSRMPGMIGGYGGGTFDIDGTQVTPVDRGTPEMSAPRKKPGYNDEGGLRGKLSSFADDLLAYSGNPLGVAGIQARQQASAARQAEAMYARRRQDELADMEYARNNPTEFERQMRAAGLQPGSPEYQRIARQYVESRANPMMPVQGFDANGNPTVTMMPRGGGMEAPPQAPVGKLRPLGGAASQGAGGFR